MCTNHGHVCTVVIQWKSVNYYPFLNNQTKNKEWSPETTLSDIDYSDQQSKYKLSNHLSSQLYNFDHDIFYTKYGIRIEHSEVCTILSTGQTILRQIGLQLGIFQKPLLSVPAIAARHALHAYAYTCPLEGHSTISIPV